jgi:hypothetical protein
MKKRQTQSLLKTNSVNTKTIPKPKISSVISHLKTRFEYTCDRCHKPIVYDALFVDDFTGKYIPLDRETMRTHFKNCKSFMRKELIVQ